MTEESFLKKYGAVLGSIVMTLTVITAISGYLWDSASKWTAMTKLDETQTAGISNLSRATEANATEIKRVSREFSEKLSENEATLRREIEKRNEDFRVSLARTDAKLDILTKDFGEIKSSMREIARDLSWVARRDKEKGGK